MLFTSHILVTCFSCTYHHHIEIYANNSSISSIYCVYVYRTILSINSHYFLVRHSSTGLSKGKAHCSLWDLKWNFIHSVGRRAGKAWGSLKKYISLLATSRERTRAVLSHDILLLTPHSWRDPGWNETEVPNMAKLKPNMLISAIIARK